MRALAALACMWLSLMGCRADDALEPRPGYQAFQASLFYPVSDGQVNLAGGNLLLERSDLSVDTLLGELVIGATYNSSRGAWRWSFDVRYDGAVFVDASGAEHPVAPLPDGASIPGTVWVKVDASRIATRGGLVHQFDPVTGRIVATTWAGSAYPVLSYVVSNLSGSDRITSIEQCRATTGCQSVFDIAYDANGCVERIDDRAGRTALFQHDPGCRTRVARDGLDVARGWAGRRYEYGPDGLSAVTSSEGERVEYDYGGGRLTRVSAVAAPRHETVFRYGHGGPQGLFFTAIKAPAGSLSTVRYDDLGRLREHDDASGGRALISWSGLRPSARTDAAGITTSWTWQDDDLASTTLPSGNTIHFEYATAAHDRQHPLERPLLRTRDDLGVIEERSYGEDGQVFEVFDGVGDRTVFAYDEEGNLSAILKPDDTIVDYLEYGDHGHPTAVWSGGYRVNRVYDAVGNLLEGDGVMDPLSSLRPGIGARSYDEDRNPVVVEVAGGLETDPFGEHRESLLIDYRSDGQPTRITRPYGGDSVFVYDGHGRAVEQRDRVDGLWRTTRNEYDARGLLTAIERPNGTRLEIDRDPGGRPVESRRLRAGVVQQVLRTTWQQGRVTSRLDSSWSGPERMDYDAAGRVSRVVFPDGESIEYEYDARSRKAIRRYVDASGLPLRTLAFGWDGADRRVRLDDEGQTILESTFVAGHATSLRYGNGLVRNLTLHPSSGLMATSLTRTASGDFVEETTTTFSACEVGLLCFDAFTNVTADVPGGIEVTSSAEGYAMGPFTSDEQPVGAVGMRAVNWQPFYEPNGAQYGSSRQAYDSLGNRIGVADYFGKIEVSFHYNAERNRLVSADLPQHRDYLWDEAGYLVRRDGMDITWDAGGRITSLGPDDLFEWDVEGRLVSARIDGVDYRTLFGGRVLAATDGTPLSMDLGEVAITLPTGERAYRHYDFRGNVKWVSGEGGRTLRHYAYGPWGVHEVFGDGSDNRHFARGEQVADFVLIGARVYDPETGRFISPDPMGHALNLYAYTEGNPVLFWDPGGLRSRPSSAQGRGGPGNAATGAAMVEAGRIIAAFGGAVIGAGIIVGNPLIAIAGAALGALGAAVATAGAGYPRVCDCRTKVIDLTPGQPNFSSSSSFTTSSDAVSTSTCAPAGRLEPMDAPGTLALAAPLQLAVAALLLRILRSRGRRRGCRDG